MKKLSTLFLFLALQFSLQAGEVTRTGLQQVRPAFPISRGHLYAQIPMRFFFQDQILELAPDLLTGETYWDIQGGLGLFYGLNDHVDFSLHQIVYQDNHKPGTGYNLPDDLFLRARVANFGDPASPLRYGGMIEVRLPIAEYHNLPLEPFSAGRVGWGLTFLASRLGDPDDPGAGLLLNANLGFFFHNDHDLVLTTAPDDTLSAAHNSSELTFGCSVSRSLGAVDLQAELYGRAFLRKPAATAYTRESFVYFSPGISYTLPSTIQFHFTTDLRLSGDADQTRYWHARADALPWKTLPNLPGWRINLGLTVPLIPFPRLSRPESAAAADEYSRQELEQELYKRMAGERKKAEETEANLVRIRAERERISAILERLRATLERSGGQPADSTAAPLTEPGP